MILNETGNIVMSEWMKTIKIRQDMNLELGEFVVMPNHFHGILIIGDNEYNGRDAMHCVSTGTSSVIPNQFGPQRKNVSSVIRSFKSSVTKNARLLNPDFAWQTRSHDHIIRDARSFEIFQTTLSIIPETGIKINSKTTDKSCICNLY